MATFGNTYKEFHRHPELSFQEKRSESTAVQNLRSLKAFQVHEHIGGCSAVGVYYNGSGPMFLLRADMDALPVQETTGLEYKSIKLWLFQVVKTCIHLS